MKHLLLAFPLVLAACQANPHRGPSRPQPGQVTPSQVVFSVSIFQDTNSNGYLDTVPGTLYVFSDDYPEASLLLPATLTFKLTGKDSKPIREWVFTEAQSEALVRRGPAGPGYVVKLSMLDNEGTDQVTEMKGDLTVTYRTSTGASVTSSPTSVRIGKLGR